MESLAKARRVQESSNQIQSVRFFDDFAVQPLTNLWTDTTQAGLVDTKPYAVQTVAKVIERCLLMTTDSGDLVLDPTCGSGTTAYVAEQWGRRWITIDTSRVALALARQRLLTAKFDYYRLRPVNSDDLKRNPSGPWLRDPEGKINGPCTTHCKSVPHITLKSIAQNVALDAIFAKHQSILDEKLAALNAALHTVTSELRQRLAAKLLEQEKREGKKAITEANRRCWHLPKGGWKEWEAPFDADEEWPPELKAALTAYRAAWCPCRC
jgi:adenine-specific DNA-methyltransferase